MFQDMGPWPPADRRDGLWTRREGNAGPRHESSCFRSLTLPEEPVSPMSWLLYLRGESVDLEPSSSLSHRTSVALVLLFGAEALLGLPSP